MNESARWCRPTRPSSLGGGLRGRRGRVTAATFTECMETIRVVQQSPPDRPADRLLHHSVLVTTSGSPSISKRPGRSEVAERFTQCQESPGGVRTSGDQTLRVETALANDQSIWLCHWAMVLRPARGPRRRCRRWRPPLQRSASCTFRSMGFHRRFHGESLRSVWRLASTATMSDSWTSRGPCSGRAGFSWADKQPPRGCQRTIGA